MAAAVFFKHNIIVTQIEQAHQLLAPLLGTTAASVLFGAALLCSGQSSTFTGTMAGQIVMEGFLRFRMQAWLRRAITRGLAIVPAVLTIYFAGDLGTYKLIIFSQVVLNLQLPFAVIPLVYFTSDRKRMGAFASNIWVRIGAWACAVFILTLNIWLLFDQFREWVAGSGAYRPLVLTAVTAGGAGFLGLLGVVCSWPWLRQRRQIPLSAEPVSVNLAENLLDGPAEPAVPVLRTTTYSRILVPLDHSISDQEAISNALALARMHGARIILLHVEEGVTSQMFGALSSTAEISEGQKYLANIVAALRAQKIDVDVVVRHGAHPANEIAAAVHDLAPDLLVMAGHGHSGLKDLIFGTTINAVRHRVKVPMLIVSKS
jgi:manganese transport protein